MQGSNTRWGARRDAAPSSGMHQRDAGSADGIGLETCGTGEACVTFKRLYKKASGKKQRQWRERSGKDPPYFTRDLTSPENSLSSFAHTFWRKREGAVYRLVK